MAGAFATPRSFTVGTIMPPPAGTVATPTFFPIAGSYTGTQSVSISTTTPSAAIYYTTNGTTPTTASTPYTGAISVSSSQTIRAIATAPSMTGSNEGSAAYVINVVVAPTYCNTPSGLNTTAGNNKVDLSWTAASGATGYKVFRDGSQIGSPSTTTYTDNSASNGTNYCYTISATGMCLESVQTGSSCASPIAPPANVQCTLLTAPNTLPKGNSVTISATLTNSGGLPSTSEAYILKWNTEILKTETFSLNAGETRIITYTGKRTDALNSYTITINNSIGIMRQKPITITDPSVTTGGGTPNPVASTGGCYTFTIGTDADEWEFVNNLSDPSWDWVHIDNVTPTSFRLCVDANDVTAPRIKALELLINKFKTFSLPPVNQAAVACPTVGSLTICATKILQSGAIKTASGDVKIYLTASGFNSAALRSIGDVSINGNIISGSGGLYVENIAAGWGRVELISGSFSFDVNSATIKRPLSTILNSVFKLSGGSVKIDNIQILTNGIRVEGMFIPMSIYDYTPIFINTLQITSTDGVKLDGKICLPPLSYGGVSLTNSCLTFVNTTNPKRFDLGTTFKMPILGEISAGGQVTEFCLVPPVSTLPNCSAEINSFFVEWSPSATNPVLLSPAISMTRIKGRVTNLAKHNRLGQAPNPITITGEIDLATYPDDFLKAQPISLTYKMGQSVEGKARLNLFNQEFSGIDIHLTTTTFKSKGFLDLYTMVTGNHFVNVSYASKLQFIGSVKGDIKMPSQATLNQITIDNWLGQKAWDYVKSEVASGKVLGTGASVFANTLGNSKLGIVGSIKTPYAINTKIFSWNGELFYKLLWMGGTSFGVGMNDDHNTIPVEFRQSLSTTQNGAGAGAWRTESDKKYAIFHLGDATTDLVIGIEGQGEMANFSINLPNGKNISAGNVGQYPNIKRTEIATANTVIYSIGNPINGKYIVEIDAPFNRMQVLRKVNPPSIAMAAITQNTTNKTLKIQWKDDDIDSDAKIQLAYDNNRADLDGVAFVDTIRKDNTSNQYVWNYGNVPTGNYYIYGFVQDSIGLFSSSYSDKKFKLVHQNAPLPPTNLGFNTSDTTLRLFWNPSPTSGVNYVVHYANKPNTVDFDSPSFSAGDTTYIDFKDFQAGKYYEFMVTAVDTTARRLESDYTNVVNLTFNPINLNKKPTIIANNLPTVAKIGTTYNYVVNATDPDGGVLVYSFAENPTGMTISNTGLITWNPTIDNWGYHRIKLYVADALGAKDSLDYQVFATDFSEPRNHAYFNFNKPLYVNHDDKAQIDLTDLGYNGNILVKDSVQATIYSKSDIIGFKLWFKETEPDSKIFRTEFNLTQTASVGSAATLKVVKGDTIFATYRNLNYPKIVSNFAHFTLLEAKFEVTKNPNCVTDSVYFKDLSTGTGLSYLWTSDDGTGITSNFQNPVRLFPVNTLREYFVVTLTIKDRLGRTSSYSKSVRRVSKPVVKATYKNISCKGQIDGSIDLKVMGAFPQFTIKWEHDSTLRANSLQNLKKGTYKAIVTDSLGCQDSIKITITEPDSLLLSAQVRHLTKQQGKDGKINLIPKGGIPFSNGQYKYKWTFPDGSQKTTEDLDNLTSGKYEVLVTDSLCPIPAKLVVLIKEPDSLSVSRTVKDITCKGGKDASIEGKIHGGVPPYKVFINTSKDTLTVTSAKPTFKFEGLDWNNAEAYEILVKDENNTAITFQVILKEPAGEIALSYPQSVYCVSEANPKATLSGIRNGRFVGSPAGLAINAQTGEIDLQKSTAGSYSVSYQTTNNACAVKPFALTIFGFPFKNGRKEVLTCGSAVLDAKNAGLTYKWSTGETTQQITVRKEGTYTVNIFNGTCNILDTVRVRLSQPTVQFKKTDIICKGEASGVIEVTKLAGGIGSYKIEWADDRTPNLRKRENLKAGTYTLIITDSICRSEQKITIVEPISELIAQAEVKGTTGCFGENNGGIRIIASGGTPPYSYQWEYKNAKTSFIDKLGNGIYSVVVTDSAKCSKKLFVLVSQADTMAVKVSVKEATCTNDGGISVEVSGGKAPYSFKWSNGSATAILSNLAPTVNVPYECIITDAQGCVKTVSTHVRKAAISAATLSGTKSFCLGESAELTVKYKGSIYPYQLTYTDGKTPVTVSGIMDSVYKTTVKPTLTSTYKLVSVVYGSNCQAILQGEANITVFNLPEILSVLSSNENCGNKDGKILVSDKDVKSGKAPFQYSIDGKTFAKTDTFGSLKAGTYTLSVKDANQCVYVYPKPIEIRNQDCLINTKAIPTVITPNGDGQNDTFEVPNLSNFKDCVVTIFNRWGTQIFQSEVGYTNPWDGTNMPIGTYYCVIDLKKVGYAPIVRFVDLRR